MTWGGEINDSDIVIFGVPLLQVPPVHHIAHDHLTIEVKGAAIVSWNLVLASCAMSVTHFVSCYDNLHCRS